MRAWLSLREQRIEFEERIIDLRRPQRFSQLAMVGEFSPSASVPVLVTDTTTIFDSLAIMEFASEYGDTPLLPLMWNDAHARAPIWLGSTQDYQTFARGSHSRVRSILSGAH